MDKESRAELLRMLASNPEAPVILCAREAVAELVQHSPPPEFRTEEGSVSVVILAAGVDPGSIGMNGSWRVRRLLDRFHIVSRADEGEDPQLAQLLFDVVANDYEQMIEVQRNVENYEILCSILSGVVGDLRGARILDYGCGSGLGYTVGHRLGLEMTGVDASPAMRALAAERGMPVLAVEELSTFPGTFTGVLASYLFHLVQDCSQLETLWSAVAAEGAVVGNFHKGFQKDIIVECMRQMGAVAEEVPPPEGATHGEYVVFRKRI